MEKHELRAKAKKLGIDGWASKSSRDLILEVRKKDSPKPKSTGKPVVESPADVNKDGVVDEKDLSAVHKEYAKSKSKEKPKAKPKAKKKPAAKKKK